jgi:hypothetical protein
VRMKRFLVLGSALLSFAASLGADGPFKFYSVAPCRIIDTRSSGGGGSLAHAEIRNFLIATKCGIPSTAKMAALNFAVIFPTDGGNITTYPYNPANPSLVPLVSTVNWTAGETAVANGSVLGLTANPTYNISVQADVPAAGGGSGHLDLVIDVTGYLQ